jgi:hypothetical protein
MSFAIPGWPSTLIRRLHAGLPREWRYRPGGAWQEKPARGLIRAAREHARAATTASALQPRS